MFSFTLPDKSRSLIIRTLLWAALFLFFWSLYLPAVSSSPNPRMVLDCTNAGYAAGWLPFVGGPKGIFAGQFGWFANPLMLLAVLKRNRGTGIATMFAVVAIGLILVTTVTLTYIPNDLDGNRVCGFGRGYYA